MVFCEPPSSGYVENNRDCNDADGTIFREAEELCDGIDNDCDEQIDEDVLISFMLMWMEMAMEQISLSRSL